MFSKTLMVGKQSVILEHHTYIAFVLWCLGDVPILNPQMAAIRAYKPGNHHLSRCLSGVRRTQQRNELFLRYIQADGICRDGGAVPFW
jgi:hypothetical protein